jgi:hypothetical protein
MNRRERTLAENALDRQLATAVRYAQQGDKTKARELLEAVLKQDRANEQAWIWLASVVDSPKERRVCIERVLKINPRNTAAQAALNTMVGVLAGGEQPRIDYAAISKAAAKPLPTTGGRQVAPLPARNLAAGGRRNFRPFLIGAALVLAVLFILTLIPNFFTPAEATVTPTSIAEITEEPSATIDPAYTPPSPTIAPTATFNGTIPAVTRAATLPPTFTPTVTETATDTPTATATLPPVTNYNWLLLAKQGSSLSAIYRVNGNGEGLEVFIANVDEIDFDIPTGLLAFTEPTPVTDETTGTTSIISRMYLASIGSIDQRTEITDGSMPNAIAPSISPDGTRLAFASDADGDYEIYVYEISSRSLSQLTNNSEIDDIDPDWSSAGSNLVFASDRNSPARFQLYNMASSGADAEANSYQVTNNNGSNTDPAWSPTSGLIVFRNQNGSDSEISLTDTDGSFTRDLTFIPSNVYAEPSWTLDGLYIVYSGGREGEAQPLILVPAQGGQETRFEINNLAISRVIQR